MQIDPETCTERCRQQTAACCCANQRERIQIYLDATCRRPFINHDINAIVFHGRIKIFFHHRRQAMNFINKEYIIRFETGQHTCQISRFIEHRTGGYLKADSQLVGNDIWKRCFSQSGRSVQQDMVECFATQACRLHKDAKVFHHLILSAKVLKTQRPECILKIPFPWSKLMFAYVKIFLFHLFLESRRQR